MWAVELIRTCREGTVCVCVCARTREKEITYANSTGPVPSAGAVHSMVTDIRSTALL